MATNTPETKGTTSNSQETDYMQDLATIEVNQMDIMKTKIKRWLFKIKSNTSLLLSTAGCSFTIIGLMLPILFSIMVEFEGGYIISLPNKVDKVEAMSPELNVFTYSASYSANKTKSVTLKLLTPNSTVWAIEGDCIRTVKKPLTAYTHTLLHENSTVQRFEAVFNKKGIPLYALANSTLVYTITADSDAKNKNGCVFLYFFDTKEALDNFLQSNDSDDQLDVQGYYNKSINCIKTDGVKHDAFFSLNFTGETFVGILANVSTNITYIVRGIIVEYNTSNCPQENTHALKFNTPLKIDICKSKACAFTSNETIIVIDSEEQGVLIHWDPKPLEFTLKVYIIIFTMAGVVILLVIAIIIIYCYLKHRKKEINRNEKDEDTSCTCARGSRVRLYPVDPLKKEMADKEEEAAKIRKVLYEVLDGCDYAMSTLFTSEIGKVADKMRKNQIITIGLYRNPSYDAIILCFKGALSFMKTKEELKTHCSNFVKSINEVKDEFTKEDQKKKWNQLAAAVEKGWKNEVKN